MFGKMWNKFVGGGITINLETENFTELNLASREPSFSHFSRARQERFLNDFSITFKTSPSVPLRREHYKRQTMAPYGVNVEESV